MSVSTRSSGLGVALTTYAVAAVVLLAMDAVWLTTMNERLYRPALAHLMAPVVDWRAAAAFYGLYPAGLAFFAVQPALASGKLHAAAWRGAALGLLCYASYDLTNQATLRDWPWRLTWADLGWGVVVSAVPAWVAAAAAQWLTSRPARRTSGP